MVAWFTRLKPGANETKSFFEALQSKKWHLSLGKASVTMNAEDKRQVKKYGKTAGLGAIIYFAISGIVDLMVQRAYPWSLYNEVILSLGIGVSWAAMIYYQDKHQSKYSSSDSKNS